MMLGMAEVSACASSHVLLIFSARYSMKTCTHKNQLALISSHKYFPQVVIHSLMNDIGTCQSRIESVDDVLAVVTIGLLNELVVAGT
jgi:hypothetical protein